MTLETYFIIQIYAFQSLTHSHKNKSIKNNSLKNSLFLKENNHQH